MKSIIALSIPFLAAAAPDACSGTPVEPGDPGAADVRFTIDTTTGQRAISRYIYGVNQGDFNAEAKGTTLARVGGKRLSAYNWETNASNAGADLNHQNDALISASSVAGVPMKSASLDAEDRDALSGHEAVHQRIQLRRGSGHLWRNRASGRARHLRP